MKRILPIILLAAAAVAPAGEYLIEVDKDAGKIEFLGIQRAGDRCYAIVDDAGLAAARRSGCECRVLDRSPREKKIYLVLPVGESVETVARTVTVLDKFRSLTEFGDSEILLVSAAGAQIDRLLGLNVELRLLPFDEVDWEGEGETTGPQPPQTPVPYNPLIEKLVKSVCEDTLISFVRYLQDSVSTRSARYADNAKKVVPWILKKLKDYGCDSVYSHTVPGFSNAPNPVGVKLGSEYPSYRRYFVMGGHCDALPDGAVNHGADDNASGISATLEAARVMKNFKFKYTIVYSGFNAQETGLCGSAEFTKLAKERGDTIINALTFDMIGCTSVSNNFLQVFYKTSMSSTANFAALCETAATKYTTMKCALRGLGSGSFSDFASFWNRGYPAVLFEESNFSQNKSYHQMSDTLGNPQGFNDTKFFTEVTRVSVAAAAMGAANNSTGAEVLSEIITGAAQAPLARNGNGAFTIKHSGRTVLFEASGHPGKPVVLTIFDASGRRLCTIGGKPGGGPIVWNGRDGRGDAVSAGIYVARCVLGETAVTKEFIRRP